MKALKAIGAILLYSAGIGMMLFVWQFGIHYFSSPHSEILKMQMRELNGDSGNQGV